VAVNIADLFEHAVDAFPDRTAIACGDRAVTFAELEGRANQLAHHLASQGIGPGDHIGLYSRNSIEAIETMLAAYKLRAVVVNVNYRYVENELRYLFDDADLVALVHERQFAERVTAVLPDTPGVRHTLVASADLGALEAAIEPDTKLVISEAPTNPFLAVVDLPKMARICRDRRVKTLIDSTFATPYNLRPVEHGVDLIIHSATKYLSGHNDVLCGVVAGKAGLVSLARDVRDMTGAICDPHSAYLVERGIKTLALRIAQQNASAQALAEALEKHPSVARVYYPGLESHPNHATAKALMRGYGGVVTFELKGDLASTGRFIDALEIPRIAPSLGGVESLVEQPALMSYFELSTEQREHIGMKDTLVRYAVGIEDTAELIADVSQALAQL